MTNAELLRYYRRYNRKYFGGELSAVVVKFSDIPEMGVCYSGLEEIYISKKLRSWPKGAKGTLLHEMVHLKLPYRIMHGPRFDAEMLRLAKAGAFNGVW